MTEEQNQEHVNYLDKNIVLELCHSIAEEIFSNKEPLGTFTDHDQDKLDACLVLPQLKAFGREWYPTILDKAAILFYAINRNHPFGNGNKRISAASLVVFLYINDIILNTSKQDFFEKTLWVANTEEDIEVVKTNLVEWLAERTISKVDFEKIQNDQDENKLAA